MPGRVVLDSGLFDRLAPLSERSATRLKLDLQQPYNLWLALAERRVRPERVRTVVALAFCFRHPFGLDTLFVNGCFEETSPGGFGRFAKCFGVGNLNAAGVPIGFSALLRLDAVRILYQKLRSIQSQLGKNKKARPLGAGE